MRRALSVLGDWGVALACFVYLVALSPFVPGLGSGPNLGNVLSNVLPLLAVALGQTLVLLTGGIDLSVTAVIALASVLGAKVMTADGGLLAGQPLTVPAAVLAMLATVCSSSARARLRVTTAAWSIARWWLRQRSSAISVKPVSSSRPATDREEARHRVRVLSALTRVGEDRTATA